ncbi:DHA2 family efflux MFS transporter permease subunit [Thauera phenolivorans]|uniref:DHA2 family efflux MFS transporter permease subunit n=1 Tax=Thauera phenolivorans TaxID=1792543 RepID=UPI00083B5A85|nr:DHA2 family efflux MFS transporter permease subunit [Thauera phenolivorans]
MKFLPGPPRPLSRERLLEIHGERYKWLALLVVGLGTVAAVLATTSFAVAVPAMSAHFGIGQDRVQWVITGYMGALTVAMLPTPWLLDRVGFRRLFLGASLLMAITSVLGALASDFGFVVFVRIVQGTAAGLLQPLATLVVMRLFPRGSQGRASGLLGFGIVLAPATAPALAGVLLDHFGWASIFLLNLPFCLLAAVLALYLLPQAGEAVRRRFDWLGVVLLCVATLVAIEAVAALRVHGLLSAWTLLALFVVALAMVLFLRHARRTEAPVVQPELFRERGFAMGILVTFAYGLGIYASTYLIPVFLQSALGYAATPAGLALLPAGIVLAVVIPLVGVLADRHSPRWITFAGLGLFAASFALLAWRGGGIGYGELVAFTILGRIGLGLIIPALTLATLRHLEPAQLGQGSMLSNFSRQFGGVLGVAVVAVFVEWRAEVHGPAALPSAYSEAFMLVAAAFVLAMMATLAMRRKKAAVAAISP